MAGLNGERLIIAAQGWAWPSARSRTCSPTSRSASSSASRSAPSRRCAHRIADLATEIECARLLVYDVAATVDANPGQMLPREASMAKLKATETAKRIALEGMQMMGGYGYAREYDMERHVRAALAPTIYGGTSEIQREIISRSLGL